MYYIDFIGVQWKHIILSRIYCKQRSYFQNILLQKHYLQEIF